MIPIGQYLVRFLGLGVFATEPLNTTCGIQQLLFAGKIGMAVGANFDRDRLAGRTGRIGGSAGAGNHDIVVRRMNFLFHVNLRISLMLSQIVEHTARSKGFPWAANQIWNIDPFGRKSKNGSSGARPIAPQPATLQWITSHPRRCADRPYLTPSSSIQ